MQTLNDLDSEEVREDIRYLSQLGVLLNTADERFYSNIFGEPFYTDKELKECVELCSKFLKASEEVVDDG